MLDYYSSLKTIQFYDKTGRNPIPAPYSFHSFDALYPEAELMNIAYSELVENFIPSSTLHHIDKPKYNFTLRQLARPRITDWIIFEAILDYYRGFLANSDLCSFSYSFDSKKGREYSKWLSFDRATEEVLKDNNYLLITDITGYYENINIKEMLQILLNHVDKNHLDTSYLNVLALMLYAWQSSRIHGFGLPQGIRGTGFLAEIFLDHVDSHMHSKFPGYHRFMDDIRICCASHNQARIALQELIKELGRLKLNVNAKKTRIIESDKEKFFDPDRNLLDDLEKQLRSKNPEVIVNNTINDLTAIFRKAFKRHEFSERHIRFTTYRLGKLKDLGYEVNTDRLIKLIIDHFDSFPDLADIFCDFITHINKSEDIWQNLIAYFKSDNCIYDWTKMNILRCLISAKNPPNNIDLEYFTQVYQDRNNHYAVRAQAYILVGKFGDRTDRLSIYDDRYEEMSGYVRRAMLVAIQELEQSREYYDTFCRLSITEETKALVEFLRNLTEPMYNFPSKYPTMEEIVDIENNSY